MRFYKNNKNNYIPPDYLPDSKSESKLPDREFSHFKILVLTTPMIDFITVL